MTGERTELPQLWVANADTPTSYLREPDDAHPPLDHPPYKSTQLRHPKQPLIHLPQAITEITGPALGGERVGEGDNDLTRQHAGEPIGERIIVSGRVMDTEGKPLRDTLVEIWQANAAGRYLHRWDRWPAPLDPNFSGAGRCVTDDEGRYSFTTIKPGPYPWGNHHNAWRPAHIHFSLLGRAFAQRSSRRCTSPAIRSSRTTPSSPACATRLRASAWCRASRSTPRSPTGRAHTSSTSCCAAPARPRSRRSIDLPDSAVADGWPVLRHRPAVGGRAARRAAWDTGRDQDHRLRPGWRRRPRSRPPHQDLAGRPRRALRRPARSWRASALEGFRGSARCGYEDGDGSYELWTVDLRNTSKSPANVATCPFALHAKVVNGKMTYVQFLEGSSA